jgi:hypothetical protein
MEQNPCRPKRKLVYASYSGKIFFDFENHVEEITKKIIKM